MPVGWLRQREYDRALWRVNAELIMVTDEGVPHSVASLVQRYSVSFVIKS